VLEILEEKQGETCRRSMEFKMERLKGFVETLSIQVRETNFLVVCLLC